MLLEYGYTAALGKAVAQVVDGFYVRCMEKIRRERATPAQRLSNMIQIQINTYGHNIMLDDAILMYQRLSSTFYPEMLDP
mmetsp:Transcript_22448/g.45214  ORF Transcript_22448/g.45214 Transcript_22448/m.45214 type:complete len:80 (+) Transcript_22448:470-709(+)